MKVVIRILMALAIMGAALALNACKDLGIGNNELGANGRVRGEVLKADGVPIVGAMVTFNGDTAYTDTKGAYTLKKAQLINERARVKVEKQGFFTTEGVAEAFDASSKAIVNVFMRERVLVAQFSAATGGRFTLGNNTTITIAPNAYRTETGGIYSGMVNLYAAAISPYDANLSQTMPGGMLAQDPNNPSREGILKSAGAFFIEEEAVGSGQNGKFTGRIVRNGNSVSLCVVVDNLLAALLASQPVQVWFYRPGYIWKRSLIQGSLNGNEYCFTISPEYGGWNLDVYFEYAYIKGKICDERGYPVPATTIRVGQWSATTDENGNFKVMVPSNLAMTIVTPYSTINIPPLGNGQTFELASIGCENAALKKGKIYFSYVKHIDPFSQSNLGTDTKGTREVNSPWQISALWRQHTRDLTIQNQSVVSPGTSLVLNLKDLNPGTRNVSIGGSWNPSSASFTLNGKTYNAANNKQVYGHVQIVDFEEDISGIKLLRAYYRLVAIDASSLEPPVTISGNFGYSAQ